MTFNNYYNTHLTNRHHLTGILCDMTKFLNEPDIASTLGIRKAYIENNNNSCPYYTLIIDISEKKPRINFISLIDHLIFEASHANDGSTDWHPFFRQGLQYFLLKEGLSTKNQPRVVNKI